MDIDIINLDTVKTFPEMNFKDYKTLVAPLAATVEAFTKIPAIVSIIQSAHESRNGNSGLARNHGNLFGIVATDSWKKAGNPIVDMPTWEVVDISEKNFPDWSEKNKSFNPTKIGQYKDSKTGNIFYTVKINLKREFRQYSSWLESFEDWGRVITTVGAYRKAVQLLTNPVTVAEGIMEMARTYATDPEYARKLLALYSFARTM